MLRGRAHHYILFVGLGLVVLSPLLRPMNRDDFPLSPFTMFADKKDENTTITHAVGVRSDGSEVIFGPQWFDTDEVLQAKATLALVPRSSKKARAEFCERLATKVAAAHRSSIFFQNIGLTGEDEFGAILRVEVRTVAYETLAYFADPTVKPKRKNVHVSCLVHRS